MYRPPGYYGNRPQNGNNYQWNHVITTNGQSETFSKEICYVMCGQPRPTNDSPGFRPPMVANNYGEEHWCETCDRGFPTLVVLEKHKQQHQKCNIDGCQFVAHPKVITKHIQMQHSTGLFKKIANLNNPEEVIKWREERKNKYPTKQNVEKKEAQVKEKIERGEKMGMKNNKNNRRMDQKQDVQTMRKYPFANENREKQRKLKKNYSNPNEKKSLQPKRNDKTLPAVDDLRKLKPFAGIQDLVMDCNSDIEDNLDHSDYLIDDDDDEYGNEAPKSENTVVTEPAVCGALSSLICNYESSDEEIDSKDKRKSLNQKTEKTLVGKEINPQNDTSKEMVLQNSKKISTTAENSNDEDDGPEEVKIDKEAEAEEDNVPEQAVRIRQTAVKRIDNIGRHKKLNQNKRSKLPSTLLQKLLHKEIQQERNIVLQCIRHIVKNNYFEK